MNQQQLMMALQQLRGQGGGTMAQGGGGTVTPRQIQAPQMAQAPGASGLTGALRGLTQANEASGGAMGRGLINALRGTSGPVTGASLAPAVQQGAQQTVGAMLPIGAGGAGAGGAAGGLALGPLAGAAAGVTAAPGIGQGVGDMMSGLGLDKTGLPDQARAVGQFVGGDFGGAWGSLKDSVKNIFSIF